MQSGLIELQTKADNAKSTAEIQSIRTLINSFTQVRAGVLHIRHAHACAQQRFLAAHGDGCVTRPRGRDQVTPRRAGGVTTFHPSRRHGTVA